MTISKEAGLVLAGGLIAVGLGVGVRYILCGRKEHAKSVWDILASDPDLCVFLNFWDVSMFRPKVMFF